MILIKWAKYMEHGTEDDCIRKCLQKINKTERESVLP